MPLRPTCLDLDPKRTATYAQKRKRVPGVGFGGFEGRHAGFGILERRARRVSVTLTQQSRIPGFQVCRGDVGGCWVFRKGAPGGWV